MQRSWRAEVAKAVGYALGMGNIALLVLAEPTTLTLGLAVALAPFTLALALKLTAFIACSFISLAVGNPRERAELLVSAVSAVQPPGLGEKYREAMLAEINAAPADQVHAIRIDLMKTAVSIVLAAWAQFFRRLYKRARPRKIFRPQHPTV
jgi:hypothetical protein